MSKIDLFKFNHHIKNAPDSTIVKRDHVPDQRLAKLIIDYYKEASQSYLGNNFWVLDFNKRKKNIHDALKNNDSKNVDFYLANPSKSYLFYGFDSNTLDSNSSEWLDFESKWIYDALISLTEAIGVSRSFYPELEPKLFKKTTFPSVNKILDLLDNYLNIKLHFPNVYEGEHGLSSDRGVISYRAVQALYQAFKIFKIAGPNSSVVEIGGGLGRTAYFALALGIKHYTIVDLPLTGVSQAYFLSKSLDQDVSFNLREKNSPITLTYPENFFKKFFKSDLVVNVDSFPEMETSMVINYLKHSSLISSKFLSINHETLSESTVSNIALSQCSFRSVYRNPYWLRRGYVEELFNFPYSSRFRNYLRFFRNKYKNNM